MTSIISICNLALASIGKDSINALTEPTVEARACNRFFAPARDALYLRVSRNGSRNVRVSS